jgi:hypothetical protein
MKMKCALEMKVAVETKLLNEEMEAMEHYLTEVLPKLNAIVEDLLLRGNGKAELMLDEKGNGKYYLGCKDYESYPKNSLPYWAVRRDKRFNSDDIIYLEHYKNFLENLCYEVKITQDSFKGCSSTGKSTEYVYYPVLKISIPTNPCN